MMKKMTFGLLALSALMLLGGCFGFGYHGGRDHHGGYHQPPLHGPGERYRGAGGPECTENRRGDRRTPDC